MILLSDIPFVIDRDQLRERLRIKAGTAPAQEFEKLVDKVEKVGRPKALCKESFIDKRGVDSVVFDGITFTSPFLRKSLDSIERVFPYVATCGKEADGLEVARDDLQAKLWLYSLKLNLLTAAHRYLQEYLQKRYAISKVSSMNPGSGDAPVWPIEQQHDLFSIFPDVEDLIGVRLTDSLVMVPEMSVSGIWFATTIDFESCQVCHRENCPGRRAPFNKELWESFTGST
jgi:hypothetical protein